MMIVHTVVEVIGWIAIFVVAIIGLLMWRYAYPRRNYDEDEHD